MTAVYNCEASLLLYVGGGRGVGAVVVVVVVVIVVVEGNVFLRDSLFAHCW